MDSSYIYFIGLVCSFPLIFYVLFKMKFQELFNAKNIWEIKVAYVVISLCICHVMGCIVERLYLLSSSF